MAEQLSETQIMDLLSAQYPQYLPLLQKPGIHDVLFEAVRNNWSAARLTAGLEATQYYRTSSSAARTWDLLQIVDPATAAQKMDTTKKKMYQLAATTGANLDMTTFNDVLTKALSGGWDDSQLRSNYVAASSGAPPGGEISSGLNQVQQLAQQYGVPISDKAGLDWARQLAAGDISTEAVKGYMIQQATSLYPGLKDALTQGQTIEQYASPYKQIAVKELNINPDDFNLSDTKWNAALSQVDPTTGNKVPLSLDQWQTRLRTDPQYGYDMTDNAKAQAATLVTNLGQKLGVNA